MKIPLSQGKFAIVGPRDYKYLMQWKWYYKEGYAVHNSSGPKRRLIYMHRVILSRMGFKDFEECDHINRNGLDNRRSNLRSVTHRQNMCNRSKQRNNMSGYIGIYWRRDKRKWYAQIQVNGKDKYLGLFRSKKKAARAYNEAARKYHGKFAVLNKE